MNVQLRYTVYKDIGSYLIIINLRGAKNTLLNIKISKRAVILIFRFIEFIFIFMFRFVFKFIINFGKIWKFGSLLRRVLI